MGFVCLLSSASQFEKKGRRRDICWENIWGGETKTSPHHKSRLIINPFAFTFLIFIDFASIKTHNRHQSLSSVAYQSILHILYMTIWSTRRDETIQLHYVKKPSNQTVSYLISSWRMKRLAIGTIIIKMTNFHGQWR